MNLKERNIQHFSIGDLNDTLPEIKRLIETHYDLGTVVNIKKLEIGETNFNYYVTMKQGNKETEYFAQLFSPAKSLKHLKYELGLRKWFMNNPKKLLKCALHCPTKEKSFAIQCDCAQNQQSRYFCMFDFLKGRTYDYDQWAFGKMTKEMICGMAEGIASYHIMANNYMPPADCVNIMESYAEELAEYKRVFTIEYEKRKTPIGENAYYDRFGEYQPRLLELLGRYTQRYMEEKDKLTECVCHMDSGMNNYIFDDNFRPIAVCDLDWSQIRPRLFDICWLMGEGFFHYDPVKITADMDTDDIATFVEAYDAAMEKAGCPAPGKLTKLEKKMIPEFFQLVAIRLGIYNIWTYIMTDNPTGSIEYNLYWGNCSIAEMEFVEQHMDEIKEKLRK